MAASASAKKIASKKENALSKEIARVLKSYPREKRYSLAILQDLQHSFGYIPREGLEAVSAFLGIKLSALYSMATFYRALSLKPRGKHIIQICDGTACHIRGGPILLDALNRSLGIRPGETTKDGLFTLKTVNCMGACAIGPVMVVDGKINSRVKPDQVEGILKTCRKSPAGRHTAKVQPGKGSLTKVVRGRKNG